MIKHHTILLFIIKLFIETCSIVASLSAHKLIFVLAIPIEIPFTFITIETVCFHILLSQFLALDMFLRLLLSTFV